jgi:flagellar motor switch protein FliN/FliY
MHDDVISQAEIDALVRGAAAPSQPQTDSYGARLLAEAAARALADLIGVAVTAKVDVTGPSEVARILVAGGPGAAGRASLSESGQVYWLVPQELALAVVTQLYGGVRPSALDDSAMGALSEGLGQMNRAAITALSGAAGVALTPQAIEVLPAEGLSEVFQGSAGTGVWAATFQLTVEEETAQVTLVLPQAIGALVAGLSEPTPTPKIEVKPAVATNAAQIPVAALAAAIAESPVKAAQFPDLTPRGGRDELRNIDLLLDVSLQVTVELGRTRRQIRDVLALGPGSVLELDKLAGELVDVLINGKLIAKGEVVVIDENYGVRITDIVSPTERVQSMR